MAEKIDTIYEVLKVAMKAGAPLKDSEWPALGALLFVHGCYRAMQEAHRLDGTEAERARLRLILKRINQLVEGWSPVTQADIAEADLLFGKLSQGH